MEISIYLEKVQGNGYRATCLPLGRLVAEAATREEALERVKDLVQREIVNGEIVRVDVPVPGEAHPWLSLAGTWKDREDIEEFEENIREYRRQIDADPDRP